MKTIQIGDRTIGNGHPCFIAAEIGINHNGDIDLACQMIEAAANAGADAVKFQNYYTEDFLHDKSLTYEYISQGKTIVESQFDMFKRCELSSADLLELQRYCKKRGIIFFSTPTSERGIADLIKVGTAMLKNGSDYLGNLPLIRKMAQTGLPTILSTGMATLGEIDLAVRAFREAKGKDLILLHCISSYPTPAEEVNLRKISSLRSAFECFVGFSDHTCGTTAAIGATVLGACFIEKHFTLNKNLPGPDHHFSSDPSEMRELVESVRTIEKNLGVSAIGPTSSEILGRRDFRLSCAAAKDFTSGHTLKIEDIVFRRPGNGVPPDMAEWLTGQTLKNSVPAGKVLEMSDFI